MCFGIDLALRSFLSTERLANPVYFIISGRQKSEAGERADHFDA